METVEERFLKAIMTAQFAELPLRDQYLAPLSRPPITHLDTSDPPYSVTADEQSVIPNAKSYQRLSQIRWRLRSSICLKSQENGALDVVCRNKPAPSHCWIDV